MVKNIEIKFDKEKQNARKVAKKYNPLNQTQWSEAKIYFSDLFLKQLSMFFFFFDHMWYDTLMCNSYWWNKYNEHTSEPVLVDTKLSSL